MHYAAPCAARLSHNSTVAVRDEARAADQVRGHEGVGGGAAGAGVAGGAGWADPVGVGSRCTHGIERRVGNGGRRAGDRGGGPTMRTNISRDVAATRMQPKNTRSMRELVKSVW